MVHPDQQAGYRSTWTLSLPCNTRHIRPDRKSSLPCPTRRSHFLLILCLPPAVARKDPGISPPPPPPSLTALPCPAPPPPPPLILHMSPPPHMANPHKKTPRHS